MNMVINLSPKEIKEAIMEYLEERGTDLDIYTNLDISIVADRVVHISEITLQITVSSASQ